MTKEEKATLADRLRDRGWRLTDEIEYTEYYLFVLKSSDKEKKELQDEVAAILLDMQLGRCFMVPINFNNKEVK